MPTPRELAGRCSSANNQGLREKREGPDACPEAAAKDPERWYAEPVPPRHPLYRELMQRHDRIHRREVR